MEDSRLQEEEKDAVDAKKRAIIVASTVKRVQQKKSRLYSLPQPRPSNITYSILDNDSEIIQSQE